MATPVRLHTPHLLVRVLRPGSAAHRARAVVRQVLGGVGVGERGMCDAESAVAELAANAEIHARPPYELRIISVGGVPTWCEVVDGDPGTERVSMILRELETGDPVTQWFLESGRGLLMVRRLSGSRCHVYPTRVCTTGAPGKAIAFALPLPAGSAVPGPEMGWVTGETVAVR